MISTGRHDGAADRPARQAGASETDGRGASNYLQTHVRLFSLLTVTIYDRNLVIYRSVAGDKTVCGLELGLIAIVAGVEVSLLADRECTLKVCCSCECFVDNLISLPHIKVEGNIPNDLAPPFR